MREDVLIITQELPSPRHEVFPFFADPGNLERITPPWLKFRILTPSPFPKGEGSVFEYKLRVRGIPVFWRTLIEEHVEGERFVDRQVVGPYQLWQHTHIFEALPNGGTRITDRVRYRLGWGIFGRIAHALWVRKDLERIFAYRKKVIAELFSKAALIA
jgi:ligand-binding SRPBCC domain-containing protein